MRFGSDIDILVVYVLKLSKSQIHTKIFYTKVVRFLRNITESRKKC